MLVTTGTNAWYAKEKNVVHHSQRKFPHWHKKALGGIDGRGISPVLFPGQGQYTFPFGFYNRKNSPVFPGQRSVLQAGKQGSHG
jgi:hypothetical protein